MKPLVTALIDTYNHQRYIEQALASVLEQGLSREELEILVVDDGSTDKTPQIVSKFAPRVKHIRKKNGGQASAFNAGFAQAQGQIVAPLDGDDWWAKGKLETVIEALEEDPAVSAVSHSYYEFHEESGKHELVGLPETTVLSLRTPESSREAFLNWRLLPMGALTVRRAIVDRILPIPEKLIFSADSAIAAAAMASGILILPTAPFFYYRIHRENLFAGTARDEERLRRKREMDEVMCSILWPMLLRLGVREECVSALLKDLWCWALDQNRESLSTIGGSRWQTLHIEMQAFRLQHEKPTLAYGLFKYVVMAPATLLFSPRQFYKARNWYARRELGRARDVVLPSEYPNPRKPKTN